MFQLKWTVEDKIICRLLTSACRFFLVKLVSSKIGYIIYDISDEIANKSCENFVKLINSGIKY